jgi:hypothetical protein
MVFIMLLPYDKEWSTRKRNRARTILDEPGACLGWVLGMGDERRGRVVTAATPLLPARGANSGDKAALAIEGQCLRTNVIRGVSGDLFSSVGKGGALAPPFQPFDEKISGWCEMPVNAETTLVVAAKG